MYNITFFNNVSKKIPSGTTTIENLHNDIKIGRWQEKIDTCRKLIQANTQESLAKYDKYKRLFLNAVTFSGVFSQRNKEGLQTSSNCIVIDIDDLEEEQLIRIRKCLIQDPHTLLLFLSPSGQGLKAVFKSSFSDDATFKIVWKYIADYLAKTYNITCDSSGKDICRLCCISYDPKAYFNPDAIAFKVEKKNLTPSVQNTPQPNTTSSNNITTLPKEIRKQRYVLKTMQNLIEEVANAKKGTRNNTLNISTMKMGQLYWTGYITKEAVQKFLIDAYLSHGDTNEAEAIATFNSGWNKGITEPKAIPEGGRK